MAVPGRPPGPSPSNAPANVRANLRNVNNLASNLQNMQTFGRPCKKDLKASAESAFAHRTEEYSDRKFKLPATTRSTFLMVFSPNGKLVASTHGDHIIYVSDVATGKCIRQLSGHPRTPWCLAFHPVNNDLLASGCLGGQVRVWDLCGGSETWCSDGQTVIASLAFHPSSDCLLVVATHNEIHFWDWNKKSPFMKIATKHEKERVRLVTFDSTGTKLFTGITNRLMYTTPAPDHHVGSDDSDDGSPVLRFWRGDQNGPREENPSQDPAGGSISSSSNANISESITSRAVDGSSIDRFMRRLMNRQQSTRQSPQRSPVRGAFQSSSSEAPSSSSSSPGATSTASSNTTQFGGREAEVQPRLVLASRRSSMTPQTRRRVPITPGLLNRSESTRNLSNQQNRRLFVREFASELFSMFSSYVQEMSSDSENEVVEPEVAPLPLSNATRPRSGGVPALTERYRRFRPLRVGRWNSNIITQSNLIHQSHLIVHSPNDAGGSSRQPTVGERGYIFSNIYVNHRIQCWAFSESNFPPDITDAMINVVVPKCKINNDLSVSISSCNKYLAAIIPACQMQDIRISIYSVVNDSLGQKLFTYALARNVVSVSFSPSAHFLLVGFSADRLLAFRRSSYPMAQIFHLPFDNEKMKKKRTGDLEPVRSVYQQVDMACYYRGINCMRWAPVAGQGLMYGTNTGELGLLH